MKIYNNFTPYAPEGDELPANVLFLRSDTGVDWYDAQKEFKESTLKVMFDSAGIICCAETDASGLWPVDCSVVEIDDKEVPVDFIASSGGWIFDGKKSRHVNSAKKSFGLKPKHKKLGL